MTIKVFVDWWNEEILTEEEYNKRAREMAEDFRTSDYNFSEFLEEHYSHRELWDANEKERAKIMEHWVDKCLDEAYDELGFENIELEV
jgi:hypothetical protein